MEWKLHDTPGNICYLIGMVLIFGITFIFDYINISLSTDFGDSIYALIKMFIGWLWYVMQIPDKEVVLTEGTPN